jgi:uncharacterized glyoxalase superfamily protein PhnB
MASDEMWQAPDIVPELMYTDVPRAVEWLERVFGFRERSDARLTWPGGGMTWLEVGNSLFNIATPREAWGQDADSAAPPDAMRGEPGFVMKIYVDDVDSHFARAQAEGAKIISKPQDGFWGGRIYRVLDHEGYQWEFSQRGRDLAADRWQLPPGITRGRPE